MAAETARSEESASARSGRSHDTLRDPVTAPLPFRLKLLLFGGALALVPVLVLGWQTSKIIRDGVKTLTREFQVSVAADVARTIDEQFRASQDGLDLVGRTLLDPDLTEDRAIAAALHQVSAIEAIDHAGVYDASGNLLDAMREETLRAHRLPEHLDAAIMATAGRDGVATGAAVPGVDGVRVLLVVPLRVGGNVTGFAATHASLARVQSRVEELVELRFEGDDGALWVVDEEGRLLADGDLERAASLARAPRVPLLDGMRRERARVVEEASGEYRDARGNAFVATVVAIPSRRFWVVARQPYDRAYATLIAMERVFVVTAVLAAVVALAAAYFWSRRITKPIELLADFANDLSQRHFDRRVTLTTRDELEILGAAMSAAAEDLEQSERRLREEAQIRRDLGRYLPGELVDKVVRREHDMGLGGTRREITVLFADVVAFTPLTEKLEAELVVSLLNELFTMLTEIVFRHGGTIDKFIGDCVMAVWGAAGPNPDHARSALEAAEDMLAFLETTNEGWKKRYGVTIQLAIGVNSGEAVVGNVGSDARMEFTAVGDVVNVAARLESIARPQQILIGAATRALAGPGFNVVDRGSRELSGHVAPVEVFEVLA